MPQGGVPVYIHIESVLCALSICDAVFVLRHKYLIILMKIEPARLKECTILIHFGDSTSTPMQYVNYCSMRTFWSISMNKNDTSVFFV